MSRPINKLGAWLKANLGPHCLAPCTNYDWDALQAAALLSDAWGGADWEHKEKLAQAFGLTVSTMQQSVQPLAYHSTAYFLDWSHRGQLWAHAKLPPIAVPRCKFGPSHA